MERVIGLGELMISSTKGEVLKTYGLSTCVGVTVYSRSKQVAGMAHFVLPAPYDNIEEVMRPAYYASKGVPFLIQKICQDYGCLRNDLTVQLYGGAESRNESDVFKVGKRNLTMVRQILENMRIDYQVIDTGGYFSRTIEMDVFTGQVKVTKGHLRM